MADSADVKAVNVQVVYALPDRQDIVRLELPAGSTLQQAVDASGLLHKHAEIDPANVRFGIYSRLAKTDTVLRNLDRIEIYRPLLVDPKVVRRQRAAQGKTMKKGSGAAV